MGTRADFYVGRGEKAEWLGSLAWDGYPDGMPLAILQAKTEQDFRDAVDQELKREDGTVPKQGWPWPWPNSRTTDYSYAFDNGQVFISHYGYGWFPASEPFPDHDDLPKEQVEFPDMTKVQNVTWGKRSGVMIFVAPAPPEEEKKGEGNGSSN